MRKSDVFIWAAVAYAAAALVGCGGRDGRGAPLPGDAAVDRLAVMLPYARPAYENLSETGFFGDGGGAAIPGAGALAFEPTYKLWSDGANKRRWIRLPSGTQIDTADMDHWVFPIGTKLWKEFARDGVLLETRLIERYGEGPTDYWMGAFVWNEAQSDAAFVVDGQKNVGGTTHDAPAQKDCDICHRGDTGRVLGFSAIQLSAPTGGPSVSDLSTMGLLSRAPAPGGYPVPGATQASQALGYLHANCGHCHNKNGTAWHDTQMVLRLRVGEGEGEGKAGAADTSEVCGSIIAGQVQYWRGGAITTRVSPGHPETSAIVARMQARGTDDQMPPLATEVVDPTGLDLLRGWIGSLSP